MYVQGANGITIRGSAPAYAFDRFGIACLRREAGFVDKSRLITWGEITPMNCVLLIGAGFSRNWGGWLSGEVFEYLLGCPEIKNDHYLKELMWRWLGRGDMIAFRATEK